MRKNLWTMMGMLGLVAGLAVVPACKTDQPGMSSNYRSQYGDMAATTEETTEAAEAVLNDLKLANVEGSSTGVDGLARGFTADGTEVTVESKRKSEGVSEVSVYVGKLGDPDLGKQIYAQIQERIDD